MNRGDSASLCSVQRSRRPQTRLETSCTRTGRPRRCLLLHRGSRTAGEGSGHTARMYLSEEFLRRMNRATIPPRTTSCGSRRTLFHLTRARLRAGLRVSQGFRECGLGSTVGRHLSKIRTGCPNERPSGSVRGAPSNWCPYRDRQPIFLGVAENNAGCHRASEQTLVMQTKSRPGAHHHHNQIVYR